MKTLFRYKNFSIGYWERNLALPISISWECGWYCSVQVLCINFMWQSDW